MKFLSFMTKVNPNKGNETKSDIFSWGIFNLTPYGFYQKILMYLNDFQNRNFSDLWLNWSQKMKMKKNQTFSMGHIQIWHHMFFYQKILMYFNDFQNRNFPVSWLYWTQTMEMKQNQTFFYGTYSNLISFFIGYKIIKYFSDCYICHFSISLQKWAQTSKVKQNITGYVRIWQYFSLFTK